MIRFRFILVLSILEGVLMPMASVSQTAVQTLSYQDVRDNIGLWWQPEGVRRRQLDDWKQVLVQGPANPALNLATAIVLTSLAVPEAQKTAPWAAQALTLLQAYLDLNPGDPVALAYFCTVRALLLRNRGNLFELLFQMGPLLEAMDRAVARSAGQDQEWLVRLVRANLFVKLPDLMGKQEVAYRDFLFVVGSLDRHPEANQALPTVHYYLGKIEQARGRTQAARASWKTARAEAEALGQTSTEEYQDLVRILGNQT